MGDLDRQPGGAGQGRRRPAASRERGQGKEDAAEMKKMIHILRKAGLTTTKKPGQRSTSRSASRGTAKQANGKGSAADADAPSKRGNWNCPRCRLGNFDSRKTCREETCNHPKPPKDTERQQAAAADRAAKAGDQPAQPPNPAAALAAAKKLLDEARKTGIPESIVEQLSKEVEARQATALVPPEDARSQATQLTAATKKAEDAAGAVKKATDLRDKAAADLQSAEEHLAKQAAAQATADQHLLELRKVIGTTGPMAGQPTQHELLLQGFLHNLAPLEKMLWGGGEAVDQVTQAQAIATLGNVIQATQKAMAAAKTQAAATPAIAASAVAAVGQRSSSVPSSSGGRPSPDGAGRAAEIEDDELMEDRETSVAWDDDNDLHEMAKAMDPTDATRCSKHCTGRRERSAAGA